MMGSHLTGYVLERSCGFANRSLELRDGRFVVEHGESVDVENLTKDRELIIDETGTVTLPPDLLVRLGGAGRYTVGNINSGYISLQGESVESMGKMVSSIYLSSL